MTTFDPSLPPPLPFAPGFGVTFWASKGLRADMATFVPSLGPIRPTIVQLHSGPDDLTTNLVAAADVLRRALPGVRLWVGCAWDGWIREYTDALARAKADAGLSHDLRKKIEDKYLGAARAAEQAGAELFVINNEAAGKLHPAATRRLGVTVMDRTRAMHPGLRLGQTSFDHPTYHGEERNHGGRIDADDEGFPWSVYFRDAALQGEVDGLLLPTRPVDLALPQNYAAPPQENGAYVIPRSPVGALAKRVAGSRRSWAKAIDLGWISPRVPVLPYVQAHHCAAEDTAALGATTSLCQWAWRTRADEHGAASATVLARADRQELTLQGVSELEQRATIAWAQARLGGLTADGRFGPKSQRALAVWCDARGLATRTELTDDVLAALACVA